MGTMKKIQEPEFLLSALVFAIVIVATMFYGYRDNNESWRVFIMETKPKMEHSLSIVRAEEVLRVMKEVEQKAYMADSFTDLNDVAASVFAAQDSDWEWLPPYHARTIEVIKRAASNNSAEDSELAHEMARSLARGALNIASARVSDIQAKIQNEEPYPFLAAMVGWFVLGVIFGLVVLLFMTNWLDTFITRSSRSSCAE